VIDEEDSKFSQLGNDWPPDSRPVGRCSNCGSPLATDQRYCIACGERRGPMSHAMRNLIAGVAAAPDAMPLEEAVAGPGFTLPHPRVAAVAITGLLAFGVLLGSVVSPAEESAADAPLIVAVSPPAQQAAAPAPAPAPTESAPVDNTPPVDTTAVAVTPPAPQVIYQQVPSTPAPTPPKPLPVPPPPPLPSVSHIWVVMLSGHGYDAAFGPNSQATYLSKTLTSHGELIPNYYAIAHGGLDNEIALLSGQGPTKQTANDCPQYNDVAPGTSGDQGQVTGDGCVYPKDTQTLVDQLFAGGNTWKAYVEDLSKGPGGCDRPAIGNDDPNHDARADNASVTWRNPFLYFHSLIDSPLCATSMADLSQLGPDLEQVGDTPVFSYIVPNRCHDGSDQPCAPDQPAGLAAADAWLQTVIPQIENSAGYTQGGLIAITFDAAPKDGPEADSSSCCGAPDQYPNLPADDPSQQPAPPAPTDTTTTPAPDPTAAPNDGTTPTPTTPTTTTPSDTTTTPGTTPPPVKPTGGGGKVGLLLISPYIKPNTVNTTGYYNHFSLFASLEDLFSIGHIGYANLADLTTFDKSVYTAYNPGGG
jgi:phosphatidylinositol-3-phosphatase